MISFSLQQVADHLNVSLRGEARNFKGCSTDTRKLQKGELFVALAGPNFNAHDYLPIAAERGAAGAILEQDIETGLPVIRVESTRKSLGRLAAMWRDQMDVSLVSVTGSNGKTTVKEMLSSILSNMGRVLATKGNLNNDIGVPATLFDLDQGHDYAVIEMGANHQGEITQLCAIAKPHVAVVTLCAPAHLEGFGSIEGVAEAKGEIYAALPEDGIAVVNLDDDFAPDWLQRIGERKHIGFGLNNDTVEDAEVTAGNIQLDSNGSCFDLRVSSQQVEVELPLPGRHNIMNALAAASCAHALNVALSDIRDGLQNIGVVSGRLESRRGPGGCRIIDDTYNANPSSLTAALDVLRASEGHHWLVLGDMGELGSDATALHADAGRSARSAGVESLYTLGDLSREASIAFGDRAQHFTDQHLLINQIKNDLQKEADKDVTLLVKGSRAARMERVVQALEIGEFGHATAPC